MATLFDGSRVATMAAGNTALAADQNTIQDKIILGFQVRTIGIPISDARGEGNWSYQAYNPGGTDPDHWLNNVGTGGHVLVLPLKYLPDDTQIKSLGVIINGAKNGTNGGTIELGRKQRDTTTPIWASSLMSRVSPRVP